MMTKNFKPDLNRDDGKHLTKVICGYVRFKNFKRL